MSVAARVAIPAGVSLDLSQLQPVQVRGDATLLEQLTANLVDNAVRHASGCVRVGSERAGDLAILRVDDDGPGIPRPPGGGAAPLRPPGASPRSW